MQGTPHKKKYNAEKGGCKEGASCQIEGSVNHQKELLWGGTE